MRPRPVQLACAGLAFAAAAAVAAPAAAQYASVYASGYDPAYAPTVGEVVVAGRLPRNVDRLSRAVSYADLDLRSRAGQDVLKWRIRDTARDLCRALGEGPGNGGALAPSCEEQAIREARPQMRFAVRQAWARNYYADLAGLRDPYALYP